MKKIDLLAAPANVELEVLEVNAGHFARKRLIAMGIQYRDKLVKYSDVSWGPVLIKNVTLNGSRIALGRKLAQKIVVGYEEAET